MQKNNKVLSEYCYGSFTISLIFQLCHPGANPRIFFYLKSKQTYRVIFLKASMTKGEGGQ